MGALSAANLAIVQTWLDKKLEEARRNSVQMDSATYTQLAALATATGITTS